MARSEADGSSRERSKTTRWVITVFLTTIVVSGIISLLSEEVMSQSGILAAFAILFVIVTVGILFDVVGVAVTSADEKPFHSMASRRVPGAREALRLLRNAERVSSICNDVVGDFCGVVSGAASATIAARLLNHFVFSWPQLITLVMSALVAGLTVGGKAVGKTIAIHNCTEIVYQVGKLLNAKNRFLGWIRRNKV